MVHRPVGPGGAAVHYFHWGESERSDPKWTESALAFGYGVDLAAMIRHERNSSPRWGLGASAKRLAFDVSGGAGTTFKGLSAWDVDLGTSVRLERPLMDLPVLSIAGGSGAPRPSYVAGSFGSMLRNALDRTMGPNDTPLGQEWRNGLGLEAALVPTPPFGHLLRALATLEVDRSLTRREIPDDVKFGLETTLLGIVSWRYGEYDEHERVEVSSEQGTRVFAANHRAATHGIGLRLGGERLSVQFDYAQIIREGYDDKLYTVSIRARQ